MRSHWRWLGFMGILIVVATIFFLAIFIVQTGQLGQRAWKSSLTPLMYGSSSSSHLMLAVATGHENKRVDASVSGSGDDEGSGTCRSR